VGGTEDNTSSVGEAWDMDLFLQQLVNGVIIGTTYAVVAIGFSLIFTVLRVINFAHPDIFMVGMFTGLLGGIYISNNFIAVFVCGILGAAAAGLVLERVVLRPLRNRDVLTTLIATLGVGIMLQNGMAVLMGADPVAYPKSLAQFPILQGAISLSSLQLVTAGVTLTILLGLSYFVRATRYGRATRAIAENPEVSAAFGVDVNKVSQVAVVIASGAAGVAAVSVGTLYGSAWAFVGILYGLKSFICMLVAGNRYFEGVMAVALLLGVLEALVTGYFSSVWRDAVAFILLIVVLFVRPNGLFGSYLIKV
jgi:branched-chain amino acid transport system permease protein